MNGKSSEVRLAKTGAGAGGGWLRDISAFGFRMGKWGEQLWSEAMHIDRLDHFALTVTNVEATCEFYSRVLGMQVVTFGNGRKALQFGQQKINLHQRGQEIDPKATKPTAGSGDFCLITSLRLDRVLAHLRDCNVVIEDGPVARIGAVGPIQSVYFRDLDGNLIEVSNYAD
jgi:catechol 2,3-dioxygenase-like lactoylglutathione lyase family enzyme